MLHPVGDLPAGVYWRRRALVLGVAASVLGGGGWLVAASTSTPAADTQVAASTTDVQPSLAAPALEQVVPSLAAVQTATPAATTSDPATEAPTVPAAEPTADPVPATPAPVAGQACTDDMITVAVAPAAPQATVGSKPTFALVVTNVSAVPCTRSLDAGLREIVLVDGAGTRVWGSNDCFPEASSDPRALAPGEVVSLPLQWGGRTSEPTCTAPRVAPQPGAYLLQGRLDTKVGGTTPFTLVP